MLSNFRIDVDNAMWICVVAWPIDFMSLNYHPCTPKASRDRLRRRENSLSRAFHISFFIPGHVNTHDGKFNINFTQSIDTSLPWYAWVGEQHAKKKWHLQSAIAISVNLSLCKFNQYPSIWNTVKRLCSPWSTISSHSASNKLYATLVLNEPPKLVKCFIKDQYKEWFSHLDMFDGIFSKLPKQAKFCS